MARLIKLLMPNHMKNPQMTFDEYHQHIEQTQYHAPRYLELSRYVSFSQI